MNENDPKLDPLCSGRKYKEWELQDDLKTDINNLLWKHACIDMTLEELEDLATDIFSSLVHRFELGNMEAD